MKLATLRVESPRTAQERKDGRLVVVDDAGGRAGLVPERVAASLFVAIEEWGRAEPELRSIERKLKAGDWPDQRPLSTCRFMAPLPRTTAWLDGSAYINHIVLVRKARGAAPPEDLRTVPLMYQGVSDPLLGPNDDIVVADESYGIDFEAEVAVITGDVPMGIEAKDAGKHIRLLCLMNDVSLRNLIPRELAAGFGFFHGKPPSAFAPYAVTPDEAGTAWKDGRLHLDMVTHLNGKMFGHPNAGPEMFFSFPQLIEHAAKTRPLPAGTVIGSGTVSNEEPSRGFSCLAEKRTLETIETGSPKTPFMSFGDRVHIEMKQGDRSLFGAIDQTVVRYEGP